MHFDDKAFFAAVERRRRDEGVSWRQVARQLNLSASTFSRLSRGSRPDLDTFWTVVAWLGVPAETFAREPGTTLAGSAPSSASALGALRESLREDPKLTATTAAALEEIFTVAYRSLTGVAQSEDGRPLLEAGGRAQAEEEGRD